MSAGYFYCMLMSYSQLPSDHNKHQLLEWSLVYPVTMYFFRPYPSILSQARTWIYNIIWCCPIPHPFCVQWEVIDIGIFVDHHCFNVLFIILYFLSLWPIIQIPPFNHQLLIVNLFSSWKYITKTMYIAELLLSWH